MNSKPLSLLLGSLLSGSLAAQVPTAVNTAFSVGKSGAPATGNLLTNPPSIQYYDFDLNGNDGASLDAWVDTMGTSAPSSLVFSSGGLNDGGRGTGGGFNSVGNQDAAHPTLVMSSPSFQLQAGLAISFQIAGGVGTANLPANLSAVPVDSADTGFQGLAIRRVVNNNYVLYARRNGNGNGFQGGSFAAASLATLSATYPGEKFVLDWVDYYNGSWGFGMVDNVRFTVGVPPGNLPLVSPPSQITGAPGYGGTLEGTLNDPFSYNPLTPTNPLPNQTFGAGIGYHNNSGNGPVILLFDLATPVLDGAGNQIVVDLYGRDANKDRDNNIDVAFIDSGGNLLGKATGLAIPDTGAAHLRVSSNGIVANGSTIAKVQITGNDSDGTPAATNNFTLMEMRVAELQAAYNGIPPTITAVNGNPANVDQSVALPSGALLTVNANGNYNYNPNGVLTTDSFAFTINYPGGTASSATASVTIINNDQIIYVDDDWAAMSNGTPITDADAGTAGNQPATFGTTAFATVNAGLTAAKLGASVTVNAGTYNETVGVADGKSLIITGADAAQAVLIKNLDPSVGTTVAIRGASVLTIEKGSFTGNLTGSGSFVKTTAGSLTFGIANSHTGPMSIDGGTVILTGAGDLGSGPLTVASATTLNATANVTLGNSITGTAALTKTGAGTVTLGGDPSGLTGPVSVNAGGLAIPAGKTLGSPVTINNGASLGGEGTIGGDLILGPPLGTGTTLTIDPATPGTLSVTGSLTLNGIVSVIGAIPSGPTVGIITYGTTLDDQTGTASLKDVFQTTSPGRKTVVDNAKTIEISLAVPQNIVFTGMQSDNWQIEGPDTNWNSTDNFFANGDHVTFDDSVDPLFSGTLTLVGNPIPGSLVFNNSIAKDYTLVGGSINGTTGLVKNNDGNLFLSAINNFSGAIEINGGLLQIDSTVRNTAGIQVNSGGTFVTSSTNFFVPTHGDPVPATKVISLDNGTWISDTQHDGRIGNVVLSNGSNWTSQRTLGSYDALIGPTTDGTVSVTVNGAGVSSMDGDGTTGIHLLGNVIFNVKDTTASSAADLKVSMILDGSGAIGGIGGIEKKGVGTMFLSAANSYTGVTTVSEGYLTIEDPAAIPNATYSKVSVAAGAGFGGIVGDGNLTDTDINAIAANVNWDAGGTAQLVLDPNGASVNVGSNLAGLGFTIFAKGGGTLNLSGNVTGVTIATDGMTTVTTDPAGVTTISIVSFTTSAGTNAGTLKATLAFTADGDVDVYASTDLVNWGTPIATNVAAASTPFVEDNIAPANAKRFYVLVPAGVPYPAPLAQ